MKKPRRPQYRLIARIIRQLVIQAAAKDLEHYDWPVIRRIRRRRQKAIDEATALLLRLGWKHQDAEKETA